LGKCTHVVQCIDVIPNKAIISLTFCFVSKNISRAQTTTTIFIFNIIIITTTTTHRAGYYRDVFKTETHSGDTLVLKENSYSNAHGSYNFKDYHFVRKDGVVSAAIQPHPLIVDTYGFCALSFFTELMPYGDVAKYAVPIFERCDDDEDDDDDEEDEDSVEEEVRDGKHAKKKKSRRKKFTWKEHTSHGHLIHMNNLTSTMKLVWALEMAESISLLNNHKNGVIVHDDVQLVQWLVTEDHEHLKLNDFNRAEVMMYDEANQEYCKYRNNPGNGDVRIHMNLFLSLSSLDSFSCHVHRNMFPAHLHLFLSYCHVCTRIRFLSLFFTLQ
jgi:hypothetical protein